MMLKNIDPMIRKLSATGMYYRDIAKVLKVGVSNLGKYMRDKGIEKNTRHAPRKSCVNCMTPAQVKTYLNRRMAEHFGNWMIGQTRIMINGKSRIYKHDVERYADALFKGIPTYFD